MWPCLAIWQVDSFLRTSAILGMNYTNLIGVDSFVAIKPSSDAIYSFLACPHHQVYMNWKKTPDHSMVTHIWLAQKCLKDIFLVTKRLQEKGIYTRETLKQRLSFHRSVLYIMALTFNLVQKARPSCTCTSKCGSWRHSSKYRSLIMNFSQWLF